MFKRNYDWIEDHIKQAELMGRPLTMGAFEECLKLLKEKDTKIIELRMKLRKYERPKKL